MSFVVVFWFLFVLRIEYGLVMFVFIVGCLLVFLVGVWNMLMLVDFVVFVWVLVN